jgi:beta-galactosidase
MKKLFLPLMFTAIILYGCIKPDFQKVDILVTGTLRPEISLNGTWKFTMNPPDSFYRNEISFSEWNDIQVPGECAMQGFAIKHNIPYVYKTSVAIPEDYTGKVIKLRFEGVYSYARVWINGIFIRDHSGGFTAWDCDITEFVKPGTNALLTVEVTDKDNEISYASGYAKHQIGGILRSVSLLALPENYPKSVEIQTRFDSKYKDAFLDITIVPSQRNKSWAGFRLYDRDGKLIRLNDRRYHINKDTFKISFPIKTPFKWDAEHPNMYTLITEVFNSSILTASIKTGIGFREVRIMGNKLMVNGRQVRLRGACRHDIHPLLGRVSTPEYDEKDVLLAREANINFIRSSHYPPSESFLRYCDKYGIYVEDETAVCFVDTYRRGIYESLKQSGPEFIEEQLSQIREMVANHRNHPSVIIWSVGNENVYNKGFKLSYDYIKSVDITRPVIFSFPGSVPDSVKCYDILSLHYPSFRGDLSQFGINIKSFTSKKIPAVYDEWAHVACYDKPELLEDVNVRNFWGQSLDSMWTNIYDSDGGAGGAIWGLIDETFMLPDTLSGYNKWWGIQEADDPVKMFEGPTVGYGEWGIIDTWRRKKPEFWNTKKAYSPIKILLKEIDDFRSGRPISIPVYNRFNHTSLKEIKIKWKYKGKEILTRIHNIEPSEKGVIQLAPSNWHSGQVINIKFLQNDTNLIDEYDLRLGKKEISIPGLKAGNLTVTDSPQGKLGIRGNGFKASLNKTTGLLENVIMNNDTLIKSGPRLHFRYPSIDERSALAMKDFDNKLKIQKLDYEIRNGILIINVSGSVNKLILSYSIKIDADGVIIIEYNINRPNKPGKAEELGLKFITGTGFDTLRWERDSYWNNYPPNHIGMPVGTVSLTEFNRNKYRETPGPIWEFDNKSFFYNGLRVSKDLSYLAGSMKENTFYYRLSMRSKSDITVYSKGDKACRFTRNDVGFILYINKLWDYNDLNWGNLMKNEQLPEHISDTIYLKIH